MWFSVIAFVIAFAVTAVWLGFVPPPHATTLVRIRQGRIRVSRGRVRQHTQEFLSNIIAEAGVSRGFIAVTSGNRVSFSVGIPPALHQRLRNIMLNQ
jgi:hypothetical protein